MSKNFWAVGMTVLGVGIGMAGYPSVGYGHKRPLPPPVIVVKPVPKVEVYRATPYWIVAPSYDFRYIVRYPPGPRAYRGVYVSWPWPVYVPYGTGGLPSGGAVHALPGEWASGRWPMEGEVPGPLVQEPSSPGPLEPTPAPEIAPPAPPAGEVLPELIPPPMPQPAQPLPEPK